MVPIVLFYVRNKIGDTLNYILFLNKITILFNYYAQSSNCILLFLNNNSLI